VSIVYAIIYLSIYTYVCGMAGVLHKWIQVADCKPGINKVVMAGLSAKKTDQPEYCTQHGY